MNNKDQKLLICRSTNCLRPCKYFKYSAVQVWPDYIMYQKF